MDTFEADAPGNRPRRALRAATAAGVVAASLLALLRFVDVDRVLLLGLVPVAPGLLVAALVALGLAFGPRGLAATMGTAVVGAALALPGPVAPRWGCDVGSGR